MLWELLPEHWGPLSPRPLEGTGSRRLEARRVGRGLCPGEADSAACGFWAGEALAWSLCKTEALEALNRQRSQDVSRRAQHVAATIRTPQNPGAGSVRARLGLAGFLKAAARAHLASDSAQGRPLGDRGGRLRAGTTTPTWVPGHCLTRRRWKDRGASGNARPPPFAAQGRHPVVAAGTRVRGVPSAGQAPGPSDPTALFLLLPPARLPVPRPPRRPWPRSRLPPALPAPTPSAPQLANPGSFPGSTVQVSGGPEYQGLPPTFNSSLAPGYVAPLPVGLRNLRRSCQPLLAGKIRRPKALGGPRAVTSQRARSTPKIWSSLHPQSQDHTCRGGEP